MKRTLSRRQALARIGMAGFGTLAGGIRAQGQEPALCAGVASPRLEGTVGLLRGQGARLSIVHHNHGDDSQIPPSPCIIVADILGPNGKLLARENFSDLGPFEARFVDFVNPISNGRPIDSRIEIFAIVRFTPGHHIGATLQIVDLSTGETKFAIRPVGIEDPKLSPKPSGSPVTVPSLDSGTLGFVRGQILRISLAHDFLDDGLIPPVCNIVADVRNAKGKIVESRKLQFSAPRETAYFDVPNPDGNGPARNTRLEASVHIRHTPGHELGCSVQIIDMGSGLTQFIPPTPCVEPDSAL